MIKLLNLDPLEENQVIDLMLNLTDEANLTRGIGFASAFKGREA